MNGTVMAKGKKNVAKPDPVEGPDDEVTVKVLRRDRVLINRAAGAKGLTVPQLFSSLEVRTFLAHMIASAGREVIADLEEQQPKSG